MRAAIMTDNSDKRAETTVVLNAEAMRERIERMVEEIVEDNPDIESLVVLGILSRGRPLADRIAARIGALTGHTPQVGSLATTLYRDDFRGGAGPPKPRGWTHFHFNVDGQTVLLVDDVLAAGRTIRAAMDEVMDYGRPKRIQLACLIDRGRRELPIQADYLGYSLPTEANEWVLVRLAESDGEDVVLLERRPMESEAEGAQGP